MKNYLEILYQHKNLNYNQAYNLFIKMGEGKFNETEIASLVSVYLLRSITTPEILGFRDALLALSVQIEIEKDFYVDVVGTGGDGKNTWNISTLSCFIIAGAGMAVTKHGNYGATSISGSSNVLEYLGYKFSNNSVKLNKEIEAANFCFLHAPFFHPALKIVAPVRKSLGFRTIFNILGPMVNPAKPNYSLVGVYNLELARLYEYILQQQTSNFTIVHSFDGYDEISLTDETLLINKNGRTVFSALELGKRVANENDLIGGNTVAESAKIFTQILEGKGSWAQNAVVFANAAVALFGSGIYSNYDEAFAMAVESLETGKALNSFKKLIELQ